MGLFSLSGSATKDTVRLEDKDAGAEQPKETSSKERRKKRLPRRTKSLDTGITEGLPSVPLRKGGRRSKPKRSVSSDGTSGMLTRTKSTRRVSMGMDSSSTNSQPSSMTQHLEEMEAFCKVLKEKGSKERNKLLVESLGSKNGNSSKERKTRRQSAMATGA